MQSETKSSISNLKNTFPSIPEAKIAQCLKRFHGNIAKTEEKLKIKVAKAEKLAQKYNLKTDQFKSLCEEFQKLRLGQIIKGIQHSGGDMTKAKTILEGKMNKEKRRERYHGRRKDEKNLQEEKLEVDTTALIEEFLKLYPDVPKDKIKKIAERSCQRLRHIGRRIKLRGKCSSSKSQKECQKSRSRHRRRNEIEKPANFQELIKILKKDHPDVEDKRLSKVLERNQFDVQKASMKMKSRVEHKKQRQSRVEDELLLKEIPSAVSKVIVDGNNLLFVNEIIRGITIRSGIARGTQALSKFISAYNTIENRDLLVVYDECKGKLNFENIKIDVARPKYSTSDDYLVAMCELMSAEEKARSMFVTSDVGLKERLRKAGSQNIMKSGKFVKICESKVPNLGEILEKK